MPNGGSSTAFPLLTADGSRTDHYDFHLPQDQIAQVPAERRDESRLMVVHRGTGEIEHRRFRDLVELIPPGDTIVLNTTRVFHARLLGTRDSGAPAELLLLKPLGGEDTKQWCIPAASSSRDVACM
jgi:S-adenosylmethionine:tRNA-ribosyltransferase-isomerase (queuine synthetase)